MIQAFHDCDSWHRKYQRKRKIKKIETVQVTRTRRTFTWNRSHSVLAIVLAVSSGSIKTKFQAKTEFKYLLLIAELIAHLKRFKQQANASWAFGRVCCLVLRRNCKITEAFSCLLFCSTHWRLRLCGRRPARPVDLNNNQICKLALLKKS